MGGLGGQHKYTLQADTARFLFQLRQRRLGPAVALRIRVRHPVGGPTGRPTGRGRFPVAVLPRLQGLEGRMFRPMAITVVSALAGSLILALFMVPAITCFVFPNGLKPHESRWFNALRDVYVRLLAVLLRNKFVTVSAAVLVVAVAVGSLAYIGTEFMPRLDEGSILVESRKLPGISLTESVEIGNRLEKIILEFPEDGWVHTGDAGIIDEDGYIFVMSRTDDVINVAGHRLSTGAIEEVLAAHDDVAECAVIGAADPMKGQLPVGFLVLKAGAQQSPEEVVADVATTAGDDPTEEERTTVALEGRDFLLALDLGDNQQILV